MFRNYNSCSILCTLSAWFLGMCYGFVLLSSAAGQNGDIKLFESGVKLIYQWRSTTLMSERSSETIKNVGFSITGNVVIDVVWGDQEKKLLKVQIESPKLHVRSRKSPSPDDFAPHSSVLDNKDNKPFLVIWENGKVNNILLEKNETIATANIKKGIASLLQLQLFEGTTVETDVSGNCKVAYASVTPTGLLKFKTGCTSEDFEGLKETDEILGTKRIFSSQTQYQVDPTSSHLRSVRSKEFHIVYFSAKEEIGSQIEVEDVLAFLGADKVQTVEAQNVDDAVNSIEKRENINLLKDTLLTKREVVETEKIGEFGKNVKNLKEYLKTDYMGTLKPTKAFLKLVNIARISSAEDISKTLSQKKNKDVLLQLYDILGYAQTDNSHAAVSKAIHLDQEEHLDYNERYLWALSFSSWPNPDIVTDLLKKFVKSDNLPSKVKETLILSLASMARKLSKLPKKNTKLAREVEETILNHLDYAKNEERFIYFRALKNLQSIESIPILLKYIQKGTKKEGVLAWKALRSFKPTSLDANVIKAAKQACFQLDTAYDSSSRALAVDILLDSQPSDSLLSDMLNFVASNDTDYETRQYTFQKIKLKADKNKEFETRVRNIIKRNPRINNYSGLSPRGLSTALERRFLTSSSTNGSLISLQEIKSGIVKRGTVSIELEKDDLTSELFSLGIVAGGLSSFVSSSDSGSGDAEEETVTAGMELTVAGTQIRPFVFFTGQGELMGHVWSGTASEMTPALQMLLLLQDHSEYIRLASGFVAKVELRVTVSFDLSGKIEISLWNRNAETLIRKSAGVLISGSTTIDSAIIKSQVDYVGSTETKLNFQSDIDFSSNVKLCVRLSQPDSVYRYKVFKTERIPNSKFNMKISNYKITQVPGVTYSINRKNNEMCSSIFS